MHRVLATAIVVGFFLSAPAAAQYQLVWSDEFDGTRLDLTKWEPEIGDGCPTLCGWGNNELEYYRAENATVAGGFLTITAKQEIFGNRLYTSARLRTLNQGDWERGRFEMRAKMPIGQGLWPAFWMLPTDSVYGTWAASGEIDIMEYLGHKPFEVLGTLHYGDTAPGNVFSGNTYVKPGPDNFNDGFHDFALEWDECEMRWYVDGLHYATQASWYTVGEPWPAPFDERFHILLNLAVGGNLPGPPDTSTVFPAEMVVDYVRVYQLPDQVDLQACTEIFDSMEHGNPFGNGFYQFPGSVGSGTIAAQFATAAPGEGCGTSLSAAFGSGGTPGFYGGFGRNWPLDLTGQTHFSFWINPAAGQNYNLEVNLQDDDNGDGSITVGPDDEFQKVIVVSPSGGDVVAGGGWQKVTIPFTDFVDDNSFWNGGNGVFDPTPASGGGNGELIHIVMVMVGNDGTDADFDTDHWVFSRHASSISGRVWDDVNADGLEAGESGLNGVTVELYDPAAGLVVDTDVTSGDGQYTFLERGGTFDVRIVPATLPLNVTPTFDPDGTGTPNEFAIGLECDTAEVDQSFGYAPQAVDVAVLPGAGEALRQNAPNPFAPRTTIEFELPRAGTVELAIYDVTGRRVRTLVDGVRTAGSHRVEWSGEDEAGRPVSAGVYYYKLRTDDGQWVRKMARLK
ncbi:MAG: family 16 glycosylhydrolase [Gemmatimonadetes bacterium]|nr:family 16 glycosylhydrolase [Gemmatimonadota bacterium]